MTAPAPQSQPNTASLPKRLRTMPSSLNDACRTMDEAADSAARDEKLIATLTARVEELESALKPFADIAQYVVKTQRDARPLTFGMDNVIVQRLTIGHLRKARAVLQPKGAAV